MFVNKKKRSDIKDRTVDLENVFVISPRGRGKERFHTRTKRPATISRSRERQCPNNGLESEPSDFWRRPASDLSKVFFLLPLASACLPTFSLPRSCRKKKRSDVPVKVAFWLLRSAVTPPPPSPAIFPNLPLRPLRSAQPVTLFSSWSSSILAL